MSGESIDSHMWAHQSHFRASVATALEQVLEELGLPAKPVVLLLGLSRSAGTGPHVCVEPEEGSLAPGDLDGLLGTAQALGSTDPVIGVPLSGGRGRGQDEQGAHDGAVAQAIGELLEARVGGRFFVALPTLIEQHRVYTAIGLPAATVEKAPSLSASAQRTDRHIVITDSLLKGALAEVLRLASRALYEPDPGSSPAIGIEARAVAIAAGQALTQSAVFLATERPSSSFFEAMNEVSTALYEKRAGVGRLIVADRGSAKIDASLILQDVVGVTSTRTMRKLLETSSRDGAGLLTDGSVAFGLGSIAVGHDPASRSVFEVVVSGPGTWDLRHAGIPLMDVRFGTPHLPEERLSRARFEDVTRRVFHSGGVDVEALWGLATAAAEAEHGTMLVVSAAAVAEAKRLSGQALTVLPTRASAELVRQVTGIDGAVLVDPNAALAAFGVILDGSASSDGKRSRGARFNSALRYLGSVANDIPTMIVLVSEDGMLNILPDLRP